MKIAKKEKKLKKAREERDREELAKLNLNSKLDFDLSTPCYLLHATGAHRETSKNVDLFTDDNQTFTTTHELLGHAHKYYRRLYEETNTLDAEKDNELKRIFQKLSRKKMSEKQRQNLTKIPDTHEVYEAIKKLKKTTPGIDGIHATAYKQWWDLLQHTFMPVVEFIFSGGKIANFFKDGVLTPFFKDKGQRTNLDFWRPITLLNVDYKIITMILTMRLYLVIPDLVSNGQTCNIKGRKMSDNTIYLKTLLWSLKREKKDKQIILVDFEKAFDRVRWKFLFKVLDKFGFPPLFIQILKNIYHDSRTFVKINGFLSEPFHPTRGVRQGDPLSPILFVLFLEPIRIYVYHKTGEISSGYCDDLTFVSSATQESREILDWLEHFGQKYSGLKVNFDKTILLFRGAPNIQPPRLGQLVILDYTKECTKYLGVFIGCELKAQAENEKKLEAKISSTIGKVCRSRSLTDLEKRQVMNQLVISKCQFFFENCFISDKCLAKLQEKINKAFKDGMYSLDDLKVPFHLGGISMVDLIARKKATINKMMNHFRQCYKVHDEKDFCWNTVMMKSIQRKPLHIENDHYASIVGPGTIPLHQYMPSFHFPMYNFTSMDNTLRPIDFVRYGSETLYYHGEEQNYFGKDENLTHTEAFLYNLIEHRGRYKLKLNMWKGFPDQCFDAVGPLKKTLESGLKEALAKDQLTVLRPQFYREMCRKTQVFNFMIKCPNWNEKRMTNNVKENYLTYRWNCQNRLLIADKWCKGDRPFLGNADFNEKEWSKILKNRRRQLENLSPQVQSFAWAFLNQRICKKWTKTCCFCNKIDANRDCNPFRHALTCPNLKEIVQYFCQTLGKVQSLKDYTAKSLLLGKENGKGYSFDDDHIIMLITFYCVWKKRNWTSHSSVDLKRKILEIFHYEYAHYSN